MTTPVGNFVWYEYMTPSPEAATKFYADVVGWKTSDAGMVEFPYTLLSAGEDMVGGLMPMPEPVRQAGGHPFWLGYIHVPDVDDYAAKVAAAGGAIHRAPSDILHVGRFAVVADPHGAAFVLFKGQPPDDPRPPMPRDALGNVGWRELRAGDLDSAFAFYSGLFGWKKTQAMDMGAMGTYQLFEVEGGQSGVMMTKTPDTPSPYWLFYFNVEAIDAAAERVKSGGGTIVVGPHEVPGGGWVVRAQDPQGAVFALLASKR
jgi:uncharacterized protein